MTDSVTLIRKIAVRSVVTPVLKKELSDQLDVARVDIRARIAALVKAREAASGEGGSAGASSDSRLLAGLATEMARLESRNREVETKAREYDSLKDGALFFQGTIDSPVEVKLGDLLDDKINGGELILNDGEVVEINLP